MLSASLTPALMITICSKIRSFLTRISTRIKYRHSIKKLINSSNASSKASKTKILLPPAKELFRRAFWSRKSSKIFQTSLNRTQFNLKIKTSKNPAKKNWRNKKNKRIFNNQLMRIFSNQLMRVFSNQQIRILINESYLSQSFNR